jgi:hypothetical protein
MIQQGEMAIGFRHFTRTDERGIVHYCAEETECVVLRFAGNIGPGNFAKIQWCCNGKVEVKPSDQLRPE